MESKIQTEAHAVFLVKNIFKKISCFTVRCIFLGSFIKLSSSSVNKLTGVFMGEIF